ncbi:ATP-binding protein [Neptuniibacter sp.]|uniref:sensor histidine kinase n=1 Tax=Neptuniibacter sp. TaxID=1962643 RepID=UPI002623E7DB|nr:ATP-binding protein [Neptuniibacter sp.]MCP4597418.1 HAMP domain-containing protein [Neptuniibacter sp.]
MKWYKRLFWKIFASIWAVSLLVLVGTILVIGLVKEKDRFKEVITAKAEGYAELMIERYERRGFESLRPLPSRPSRDEFRSFRDHDRRPPPPHHRHPRFRDMWSVADRVLITDLKLGQDVVSGSMLACDEDDKFSFNLRSESGRLYQVDLDQSFRRSPVAHMLNTILSVQMVLILLVSGLGALLVSTIIVRPLNRLREHTQAIYSGELDRRTDEPLHKRGDELGELARDFDRMADYVQQTINSHQRLMQDVSHELRAPLARLQAAAGLAEQKMGEDDKVVARISRECQRLDQLIGEILSLSRLEQEEVSGESVKLAELLKEMVDDARFAYPKRTFNLHQLSDCSVSVNRKLLERALNNILGNACKHTAEDVEIDLSVDKADQCVVVIRDHGQGVTDDQLSQLCDPFFRGNSQNEGYGLGLSIAQRAIERLGGELSLRNHPDGGLEVRIGVPCEKG